MRSARIGFLLMVLLLAMFGVGKAILADTMDPDAFWHLRVAEQLQKSEIGPIVDNLSYNSDKTPWTPYSWLAELFMKLVWDVGGFRLAIVVTAICSGGIIFFSGLNNAAPSPKPDLFEKQKEVSYFTSILATVLVVYFTLAFISFRPVTFALLIQAVNIYLLYRDRRLDYRSQAVWLVPTLTLILTNFHIYSIFMVGVTVLMAMGSYTNCRPRFLRNGLVAIATMIAACCTPMLKGAIETSQRYNNVDPMIANRFISEMAPFYGGIGGKISLGIVILLVGCAIYNYRKLQITDWLLIGFGLLVLFRLGRFAPVFAMISMPIFTRVLPQISDRTLSKRIMHIALAGVLVMGFGNIAISFPGEKTNFNQWLNRLLDVYPTDAADWAEKNVVPRTHRIINEFNWGGYLAWRFGEHWQVLLDGRTQLYAPDFWNKVYFGTPESQKQILTDADADFAIIPAKKSAFKQSLEELGWQVRYEDKIAIVMTRSF